MKTHVARNPTPRKPRIMWAVPFRGATGKPLSIAREGAWGIFYSRKRVLADIALWDDPPIKVRVTIEEVSK